MSNVPNSYLRQIQVSGPGAPAHITVEISPPTPKPNGDAACTVFVSDWMGRPIRVSGADEMDALRNSLELVSTMLDDMADVRGWKLSWLGPEDGGGF